MNIQVLCAIDGVEITIGKSTHKKLDDTFYSVKKSQHSINIIVICALDGQLLPQIHEFQKHACGLIQRYHLDPFYLVAW